MSQITQKSVDSLIQHAFPDMLQLLEAHHEITSRVSDANEIKSFKQHAAMFTVSSSHFRLVILLHYPDNNSLDGQQLLHFRPELKMNTRQYQDYLCELGNNLCGVICRVLGADDFSTGMSTPALLNITNSAGHLQRIGPFCEAHMASFSGNKPLLSTTISLFFNSSAHTDLSINIPNSAIEDDSLGELEFF